jgi:1-deoxy-D-xylulose-5-phosphate reductoisomerase
MNARRVTIAGSTGSIGTQTLEFIDKSDGRFVVSALCVGSSADSVVAQAKKFRPEVVVVTDETARRQVAAALPQMRVEADMAVLAEVADVVVNGVVGFAGLEVTMSTLRAGKRLALANKESLIAAGPVVNPLRATPGAELIPVDSEHCAIHQCLRSSNDGEREVSRLLLTASGGPFRGRTADELRSVTREEALKHPTWSMGPKITIDSSTLMNKGLEVIEAHELFGIGYDQIDVVVHPQSVVHSMVEFTDAAVIAQLSMPDMRLPIAYALEYPQRSNVRFGDIDWTTLKRLDFETPNREVFRCLDLAYQAGRIGGTAPAWLSAANEVAVAAFLDGRLSWWEIASVIERAMQRHDGANPRTLEDVLEADRTARRVATEVLS